MRQWYLHLLLVVFLNPNSVSCQTAKTPSSKYFGQKKSCLEKDITDLKKDYPEHLYFQNPSNQFNCWKRPRDGKLLSGTVLNKDASADLTNSIQSQISLVRSLNGNEITPNFECEYKDKITGKHYYMRECISGTQLEYAHFYYRPKVHNLDFIWVKLCRAIVRVMEKLKKYHIFNVNLDLRNWALLPNTDTEVRVLDLAGARQQSVLSRGWSKVTNLGNKEKWIDQPKNQEVPRLALMFKELYELLLKYEIAEPGPKPPRKHYKEKVNHLLKSMHTKQQENRYSLSDTADILEGFEQLIQSQRKVGGH